MTFVYKNVYFDFGRIIWDKEKNIIIRTKLLVNGFEKHHGSEEFVSVYEFGIEGHSSRGFLNISMQHTKDHWLAQDNVRVFRKGTESILDEFMIAKVNLFRKEEALFHGNGEICDSLDFLLVALIALSDAKLRRPNRIDILFVILNNVVEHKIQENKQLNPHEFVILALHEEQSYFWIVGLNNKDVLLRVDWWTQYQQFRFDIDTIHPFVVNHGGVDWVRYDQFCLENRKKKSVGVDFVIKVVPIIPVIGRLQLVLHLVIQIVKIESLDYCQLVNERFTFF